MDANAYQFNGDYFGSERTGWKRYKDLSQMQKIYFPKSVADTGIRPGSRVLDIGCAFGYFLRLCDDYGLETYGLDISGHAIAEAKKITVARLYQRDVNEGLDLFSDEYFDLVTMFDVIEHVKSPYSLLREVHRILKRGAKTVITTPNLNAVMKLVKGNQWVGTTDPTHLYLFTTDSLRLLVEKNGFIATKLETAFQPLPRFLQRILNKTGKGGEIWLVATKV